MPQPTFTAWSIKARIRVYEGARPKRVHQIVYPCLHSETWWETHSELSGEEVAELVGCSRPWANTIRRKYLGRVGQRNWNIVEGECLERYYSQVKSGLMAVALGRSVPSVQTRAHRQGVQGNRNRYYTPDPDEFWPDWRQFITANYGRWIGEGWADCTHALTWQPPLVMVETSCSVCEYRSTCRTMECLPCERMTIGEYIQSRRIT